MDIPTDAKEKGKAAHNALKRAARGGKRLSAVIADELLTGLLLLFVLYLTVRVRFRNAAAARLVTLAAFGAVTAIRLIVKRELRDRRMRKLRGEAEDEAARMKLLMEPELLSPAFFGAEGTVYRTGAEPLTADELRDAVNGVPGPLTIVTLAPPTPSARELATWLGGRVRIMTVNEYFSGGLKKSVPVTYGEIGDAILKKYGKRAAPFSFKKLLGSLSGNGAVKYLSVGAGLFLLSFIVRYPLYYRLAASLCMSIGAGAAAFGAAGRKRD